MSRTGAATASDRTPHALPEFDDVDDERRHRKQRLAAAFRLFGHFGFGPPCPPPSRVPSPG